MIGAVSIALGIGAVLVGTVLGGAAPFLDAIVAPPTLVRAALIGASTVGALALLRRAVSTIEGGENRDRSVASSIRGVRLAFLALAALAAASGWLIGHPLPLLVALVIAGIDVVETTFLLIVAARNDEG